MESKNQTTYNETSGQLRSFIERIERLEAEKKTVTTDISEVFAEAKGNGFDTKAMREVLKIRKQDPQELEAQEHILDTYKMALGMLPEEEKE